MGKRKNHGTDLAKVLYALSGLLFVLGICLIVFFGFRGFFGNYGQKSGELKSQTSSGGQNVPCNYRRNIDGVCVQNSAGISERAVAVMVENSRDAWPLSGVSAGSIVYEAPAESGIPRFLILFPVNAIVPEVGPVRSSRPYFLDWASEYGNPMYMHVGGSPDALKIIEDRNVFDMNEMHRGWYFWRSEDRNAPHNTYTSNQLWQKAVESYGKSYPVSPVTPLAWSDEKKDCTPDCFNSLTVSLSGAGIYDVLWKYNSSTDQLVRFHSGEAETDKDGSTRLADTVIVQWVHATVLDEIGRKQIDTVGHGDAKIFTHGKVISGVWQKDSVDSRTEWLDVKGNPIPIKPGKIWIEVVPTNGGNLNWN